MQEIKEKYFEGERALYGLSNTILKNVTFGEGESPLKETKDLEIKATIFKYKYPLWYSNNINITDTIFETMSRSGIWYTNNISIKNSNLQAPKLFRRCKNITLDHIFFSNAEETMWTCEDITIKNTEINGDYFGKDSSNIYMENVRVIGNYVFDGAKNIVCKNCSFVSKDAFWNCENVTLINCQIDGEYLSWNSSHITFKDCTIESDQGLCYMDYVTLENCILNQTPLAFEKCSNIKATINSKITSIKNPISGIIKAKKIETVIIDPTKVDPKATKIIFIEPVDREVFVSDQNQEGE